MEKILATLFCVPALLLGSTLSLAQVPVAPTADDQLPNAIVGKGTKLGSTVNYYPANTKTAGYYVEPASGEPKGAVILIHEWNGLVDRIKETADAFAAEGYIALAADLYSGRLGSNPQENMALVNETSADQQEIINNLNAAVNYLRQRGGAGIKVATIGWCFGGGIALSYAVGGENHDGTAVFYGNLLNDPEQMQHIHHEIYGTFARNDNMFPAETVEQFVEAMRNAGIKNDVHIYDDVGHGFWLWVDQNQGAQEPALDAWQRLKAYLKRTISG